MFCVEESGEITGGGERIRGVENKNKTYSFPTSKEEEKWEERLFSLEMM